MIVCRTMMETRVLAGSAHWIGGALVIQSNYVIKTDDDD